jgi:hypothetical protein
MRKLTIIAALALTALVAFAAPARADVACSVWEIEASSAEAPSVDPELKPLERKLKKPPFSSWNVFKRLGNHNVSLAAQQVGEVSLVHGKAALLLREVSQRPGKKPRVSLGITLDDAGGKRVIDTKFNVDSGDFFVVGRSLPENKGQLVALTCKQ